MRNFQLIIISIFFSGSLIFSQEIIPSIKSKYIIEIKKLAEEPKIKAAFKKIDKLEKNTQENLIFLTEIPAPPFNEDKRAEAFAKLLNNAGADRVFIDKVGNVIAELKGPGNKTVLIEGHLDTVFPMVSAALFPAAFRK